MTSEMSCQDAAHKQRSFLPLLGNASQMTGEGKH